MPRLNAADKKRLVTMVQRGDLHPVLNHTKWAELRSEMLAAPMEAHPRFRVRTVFSPPGFCSDWDSEFYYHIHPVEEREWLELKSASAAWLHEVLRRNSIPFSVEDGVVRVWGYTHPGLQPQWV
ncbi:DUF6678 family protein [Comamonas koreensis]|uniref:Uncharacterized protein n=1 Tax=Comamonas koreensis TaxID=160825 RepID=A0AAW4XX57_9BURK|nr:DUF6678 family protein [Comamonas koreensis]MCD2166145.1 hypothetical protein [Comamonas koreensis]